MRWIFAGWRRGTPASLRPGDMPSGSPKLLDRVREAIRTRQYSRRTEVAYVTWIRRYIVFHRTVHPDTLGAADIWVCDLAGHTTAGERVHAEPDACSPAVLVRAYPADSGWPSRARHPGEAAAGQRLTAGTCVVCRLGLAVCAGCLCSGPINTGCADMRSRY